MESKYICSVCQKSFGSIQGLTGHQRVHKSKPQKPAKQCIARCNVCSQTFETESAIRGHIQFESHDDITRLDNIEQPVEQFMQQTILQPVQEEIETHSEEQKQEPEMPDVSVLSLGTDIPVMPVGVYTTTVPRQYIKCYVCPKAFDSSILYIEHIKTHPEGIEYECGVDCCDISFANRVDRDMHRLKHPEYLEIIPEDQRPPKGYILVSDSVVVKITPEEQKKIDREARQNDIARKKAIQKAQLRLLQLDAEDGKFSRKPKERAYQMKYLEELSDTSDIDIEDLEEEDYGYEDVVKKVTKRKRTCCDPDE